MTASAFATVEPAPAANTTTRDVRVVVAHDIGAIMQAFALRALVYMGEQACPFDEEFDGADFSAATHLIASVGSEPVGTLRIRWFARFAKIERVAVKSEHRGGRIATALVDAAIKLAQRRGHNRALAYIQVRLIPFWESLGFSQRGERPRFCFSDHVYIEMTRDFDMLADALSIDTDPLVLLRPDGAWDKPGVLDRSQSRRPSNPHR